MSTPKFDRIAARGNSGHFNTERETSHITCADGVSLSVIAGGGSYCTPRPSMCFTANGDHRTCPPIGLDVECTYPGPYSAVEVMMLDETPYPECWDAAPGDVAGFVPVALVREFIESHGGER